MAEETMVCECENCGNEAEMTIKCHLEPIPDKPEAKPKEIKTLVCTECGNEAEMTLEEG